MSMPDIGVMVEIMREVGMQVIDLTGVPNQALSETNE